jgi:hypothetical protein
MSYTGEKWHFYQGDMIAHPEVGMSGRFCPGLTIIGCILICASWALGLGEVLYTKRRMRGLSAANQISRKEGYVSRLVLVEDHLTRGKF